jgi:ATP-dependent exoDNAse (exonuclease V) beta subunit
MSKAGVLPDLPARRRALLDHSTTLLVEAGAGSGKTALMAGRVALLLAAGIPTREIVAITFTEAAASELHERIEGFVNRLARAEIPDELRVALPAGLSAEQSAAIAAADETLDELTCTTIHGFCQKRIQETAAFLRKTRTATAPPAAIDPGILDLIRAQP